MYLSRFGKYTYTDVLGTTDDGRRLAGSRYAILSSSACVSETLLPISGRKLMPSFTTGRGRKLLITAKIVRLTPTLANTNCEVCRSSPDEARQADGVIVW